MRVGSGPIGGQDWKRPGFMHPVQKLGKKSLSLVAKTPETTRAFEVQRFWICWPNRSHREKIWEQLRRCRNNYRWREGKNVFFWWVRRVLLLLWLVQCLLQRSWRMGWGDLQLEASHKLASEKNHVWGSFSPKAACLPRTLEINLGTYCVFCLEVFAFLNQTPASAMVDIWKFIWEIYNFIFVGDLISPQI